MTWIPSAELQKLVEFIQDGGIPPILLKARLLQIALSDANMAVSLKALEMLIDNTGFGDSGIDDMSYEEGVIVEKLVTEMMGAPDADLSIILADVALTYNAGDDSGDGGENEATDLTQSGAALLSGISPGNVSKLPLRPTQSDGDGHTLYDGDGSDRPLDNGDASAPLEN